MVNITAPILPGYGAANIELGSNVGKLVELEISFTKESEHIVGRGDLGVQRYRSRDVDIWVKDEAIWQIMVHGQYSGKIREKVGIGSTVQDIKQFLGPIDVIMDNYVVSNLPGCSFELETDQATSVISEIYIFKPDWTEVTR